MNAHQYNKGIQLTTMAALKSKDISLPEIVGTLQLAIIQVERMAFEHAQGVNAANEPPLIELPNMKIRTPGHPNGN